MNGLNLLAVAFTDGQILIIALICVLVVLAIVGNILLIYYLSKRRQRKLCSRQLQQRREEILKKLASMNAGTWTLEEQASAESVEQSVPEADEDEADDVDEAEDSAADEDDSDDVDEADHNVAVDETVTQNVEPTFTPTYKVLAVRDMSLNMRIKFGFTDVQYDRKQYFVRYSYGFDAKLRASSEEVQQRYQAFVDEVLKYKGVKIRNSFRQQRITKGRTTLALVLFRGKTLCAAFALNPSVYADTKYRGIDKSDKKRFAQTPMLLKLTSSRKGVYADYLFAQVAYLNTIVLNPRPVEAEHDFAQKTDDELFDMNQLHIAVMGEAEDLAESELDEPETDEEDVSPDDELDEADDALDEPEVAEPEVVEVIESDAVESDTTDNEIAEYEVAEDAETEVEQEKAAEDVSAAEAAEEPDETAAEEAVEQDYAEETDDVEEESNSEELDDEAEEDSDETAEELDDEGTEAIVAETEVSQEEAAETEITDKIAAGVTVVRYNRSFDARIIQAPDAVKSRYSDIKNHLLSYKKVKSKKSWKRESFRVGRKTVAVMSVRGKTLCISFAADPARFDGTKYKVTDRSIRSPKCKQPSFFRVSSDRKAKYAKEIVDMLMAESGAKINSNYVAESFMPEYESTAELVERGLIKVVVQSTDSAPDIEKAIKEPSKRPQEEVHFTTVQQVDAAQAAEILTDKQAKQLIEDVVVKVRKRVGKKKGTINISTLSLNYEAGETVTIDSLHAKRLIPDEVGRIKVLADGILDKPLIVEANDFSVEAVKMIVLTGGRAIRSHTVKK